MKLKLRSTTPELRQHSRKIIFALAALVFIASPAVVFANSFEDEIESLDTQISQNHIHIENLQAQANTLQNKLSILAVEKSNIQTQININDTKRAQLITEIKANEIKITEQQEVLGSTLGDIYVGDTVSPIEMIASAGTIGDYIDKAEYQTSISDGLQASIVQINELKAKLAQQQKKVEEVIVQQKGQRDLLVAKEREQSFILAETRGKEAAYRGLVSDLQKQREQAEAALAASLSTGSYKAAAVGFINAGETVGFVGNSGLSSGPHLHLELREGNSLLNPNSFIGGWQSPGGQTQGFGESVEFYGPGGHPGLDYGAGLGTPIQSLSSGNLYRGCSDAVLGTSGNPYGYVAIVEHSGSNIISIYAHLDGGPADCSYNTYYGGF